MESIGLFQLENLMISRSPYVFLDVRKTTDQVLPAAIAKLLASAVAVAQEQVKEHLQALGIPKALPILLVSEDDKGATRVAQALESAGYLNVYTIAGGVTGLVSEL